MNVTRSAWAIWRAPRLEPAALRRLQSAKLRRIVAHAYATVPFYRQLWSRHGIEPGQVRGIEDLPRLPVVDKRVLQAADIAARLSSACARPTLIERRTSGSTGRPMTLLRDRPFERHQKLVFLRALLATGLRPWHRLLLLSDSSDDDRPGGGDRRGLPGWRYVASEAPAESLLEALLTHRPHAVYGFLTPLRQLAQLLRRHGRPVGLRAVITTAETLDGATRAWLADSFQAEVFDLYGCTEVGPVAWECRAHLGYHVAADTVIVECQDAGTGSGPVLLTSLDLRAMPLIRYAVGDLAVPAGPGACPCGCRLPRLARLEGRLVDCVQRPAGGLLSPYHLTLALEDVAGLERFQIVQEGIDRFLVRAQGRSGPGTDATIAALLRQELGAATRVEVRWEDDLAPPPGRKFRVVECRLPGVAACAS